MDFDFNKNEFENDGYNTDILALCIENIMHVLSNMKSKEAKWLYINLESLLDECEC